MYSIKISKGTRIKAFLQVRKDQLTEAIVSFERDGFKVERKKEMKVCI